MADSFDHFVIPKFGGINLSSRPHSISPEETDDLLNVWGDGTYFRKRPGIRFLSRMASGGGVGERNLFDMVRVSIPNSSATNKYGYDAVLCLFRSPAGGNTNVYWGYWRITPGTVGSGVTLDRVTTMLNAPRMVICSDRVAVLGGPSTQPQYHVLPSGSTQDYAPTIPPVTFTGTPPTASFGAWHKQHLFACGGSTYDNIHNVQFSDFNSPLVWPAANKFTLNPTGGISPVTGIYSDGEILYVGKAGSIYGLTGSTVSDFRIERITNSYGFTDCKAMTSIGDMVMGFNVEPGGFDYTSSSTIGPERIRVRGIIAFRGMGIPEEAGDKISTLFEDYPASNSFQPRAEYNRLEQYAIFIPNNPSQTAYSDVVTYEKTSGSWFRWGFASSAGSITDALPACLAYGPGPLATDAPRMYVGTHYGSLGWFDPTLATDQADSTNTNQIESYWTSAWITRKSFENFKSLEDVFIQGLPNTAGDDPTLSVAVDYSNTFTPIGTFPLREDGTLVSVSGKVNMSRSVKIKISFANNSYGGEVRRVVLAQKGFGIK